MTDISTPEAAIKCDDCACFQAVKALVRSHFSTLAAPTSIGQSVRKTLAGEKDKTGSLAIQQMLLSCDPSRPLKEHYDCDGSLRLGAGAYGSVFSAKHRKSEKEYAVKVIVKDDAAIKPEMLASEIALLASLDHPNVVRLYEYFEEEKSIFLVTELVVGGDLGDMLQAGELEEEADVTTMMYQLAHAIAYCHGKGVIHRDLKMDNCLVDHEHRNVLKVIDFGMAVVHEAAEGSSACDAAWMKGVAGTVPYMSPEMVDATLNHGAKTDMWSAGVIMYLLLSGGEHPLWQGVKLSEDDMFQRILQGVPNMEPLQDAGVSPDGQDLVSKMLRREPNQRLGASDVLAHPWFAGNSVGACDLRRTLGRLGNFTKMSKFEQAVLTVVAHQSGESEVTELERAFTSLDTNCTGSLSKDELRVGFQECGLEVPEAELNALFDAYHVSGTDKIEYTGWLAGTMKSSVIDSDQAIKGAFAFFDASGDGELSREELLAVLGAEEAAIFWRHFSDIDKTSLSFEEFKELMHDLARRRSAASSAQFGAPSSPHLSTEEKKRRWTTAVSVTSFASIASSRSSEKAPPTRNRLSLLTDQALTTQA
mmetsp:Transcript_29057/g.66833  ORF Transcript_29057/g.66833 Transcript_29057/m.66833 type:complete len:590 (+) Transcript_29057:80-1849(+)